MLPWPADEFRTLRLEEIDERYRRYRVTALEAEEAMARRLRRYGQISPLVVCLREEVPVLVDGFKRLAAARGLKGFETLSAKRIDADERAAKAAMYGLNRTGRHFGELEEERTGPPHTFPVDRSTSQEPTAGTSCTSRRHPATCSSP